ncbi:hypothetical protein J6590_063313 [Homalodisca vitripennis]|nr:hypothetical protein J6590_063313 [Homalodisca vitripennis]
MAVKSVIEIDKKPPQVQKNKRWAYRSGCQPPAFSNFKLLLVLHCRNESFARSPASDGSISLSTSTFYILVSCSPVPLPLSGAWSWFFHSSTQITYGREFAYYEFLYSPHICSRRQPFLRLTFQLSEQTSFYSGVAVAEAMSVSLKLSNLITKSWSLTWQKLHHSQDRISVYEVLKTSTLYVESQSRVRKKLDGTAYYVHQLLITIAASRIFKFSNLLDERKRATAPTEYNITQKTL